MSYTPECVVLGAETPMALVERPNHKRHSSVAAVPTTSDKLIAAIPIQRIITPIREEDKQFDSPGASPVEYKPITIPSGGERRDTSSSSASNTASSESKDGDILNGGPNYNIVREGSPPPVSDVIVQRKNESRYRLCLRHDFHPSRSSFDVFRSS